MNGKLLITGAVCLAIFVVPATLMYGRDPNSVWFLVPLVPVALVGASLVLLAAMKALFGAFGFSGAIASLSAGLIAIVQYFIGSRMGMQGMSAFWSAVFAWCGGGLAVISGVMWLRLQGGGDRDR